MRLVVPTTTVNRTLLLATNSVGEPVWASLALARGMVFIRGDTHVFGIK